MKLLTTTNRQCYLPNTAKNKNNWLAGFYIETEEVKQSLISQGIDENDIINIQKMYKSDDKTQAFVSKNFNPEVEKH